MLILVRWPHDPNSSHRDGSDEIRLIVDGHEVKMYVMKVERTRVTIGIDAPPEVRILRGDLEERDAVSH